MANPPPHFVVFVPGYMGSKLRNRRTGELIWLDIAALLRNPFNIPGALSHMFEQMRYPNDDIVPDGILDEVVFLPPLFKMEQYGRMIAALDKMGYDVSGKPSQDRFNVYSFAYDWRQDNRISGRQLGDFIKKLEANHPGAKAIVIGHSNGGIVARWYIEKEGGKDHVARLFLMGSPWDGAPKAFQVLQDGLDTFLLRIFNRSDNNIQDKIRAAVLSFPSFYHLIPTATPFLQDVQGAALDPFTQLDWLENDDQRRMLFDGRKFNQELGNTLSVDTLCFFGVKNQTTTGGRVSLGARGLWTSFEWLRDEAGDGTVPLRSAIHPNAHQKLPYTSSHGDIYILPPVLDKLEFELLSKYRLGVLAEVSTPNLTIQFEPDRDDYRPDDSIGMWATVHRRPDGAPVYGAEIDVQLLFHQALPGFAGGVTDDPPSVRLVESPLEAGRYEGSLTAPQASGYYRLVAVVRAGAEDPVPLEELILIEGEPQFEHAQTSGAEPPGDEPQSGPPDNLKSEPPAVPPTTSGPSGWTMSEPPAPLAGGLESFGGSGGFPTAGEPPTDTFRSWETTASTGAGMGTAPGTSAGEPGAAAAKTRFLAAEIADRDPTQPLPADEESTLMVFIDERAAPLRTLFVEDGLFDAGENLVNIDVILSSADFIIHTPQPQQLRLPRSGASRNKVRFDLEPRHGGVCHAAVYLYKDNNFIQGIDLTLNVAAAGEPAVGAAISAVTPLGRMAENLSSLKPRDVLLIIKSRGDAFDMTLVDEAVSEARLVLSAFQLNQIVARARQALLDVVYLAKDPSGVNVFRGRRPPANVQLAYQTGLDIPAEIAEQALRRLAEEGLLLFQDLFFSPSAGIETRQIGDRLRTLAQRTPLKLQIVSQNFLLPWGLLYIGDDLDHPDAENFLGMRHTIEQIPLQASPPVFEPEINSQPVLKVSLNVDESIDAAMGQDFVNRQVVFWQRVQQGGGVQLALRKTDQEWIQAMKEPAGDQFLYFYGHALTPPGDDPAGPDGATLSFTGQKKVSLRDLRLRDLKNQPFPGKPLVFINACESAELSPLFYGGFMPYFTAKGARGMIGTECEVPAIFAAEWAQRFFDRFLYREQPVGKIFLDLRREFYFQNNNLLGLLYALYCDGDTRVSPPVKLN